MDDAIDFALERRTWAVVGCSPSPRRDSHRIAALLKRRGHRVIPVNPNCDTVLGERAYARLEDIPEPIDVVDIFRRSEAAGARRGPARGDGPLPGYRDSAAIRRSACRRAAPGMSFPSRSRLSATNRYAPEARRGARLSGGKTAARPSPAECTVPSGSTTWNDRIRSSSLSPGKSAAAFASCSASGRNRRARSSSSTRATTNLHRPQPAS